MNTITDNITAPGENAEPLHIDGTKARVRIPNDIYACFVSPTNMKTDINMPLTNVRDNYQAEPANTAGMEKYQLNGLSSQVLYSCWMARQMDMTLTVTGCRYGQNKQISFSAHTPSSTLGSLKDYTGLPHPYLPGIFGTVCDPLNSMLQTCSLTIGGNNQSIPIQLSPGDVDVHRRMADYSVLNDGRYQGLLYCETENLSTLQYPANRRNVLPFKVITELWNLPSYVAADAGQTAYPTIIKNNSFITRTISSESAMTLDDVNNDPYNRLSLHYRGQIFKNATYTFSKAVASPNYKVTFNAAAPANAAFAIMGPASIPVSTQLWTMKIGDYCFPSNVENWAECLENGINPYTLMWYYDKNPMAYVPTAPVGGITGYTYPANFEEPVGQSLTMTIVFPHLQSPVINPLLNDRIIKSFTNCTQAILDVKYASNLETILLRTIGKAGSSVTVTGNLKEPAAEALPIANANTDGVPSLSFSQFQLNYRQYQAGLLQSDTKETTCLPYIFRNRTTYPANAISTPFTTLGGDSTNWRGFKPIEVNSVNMPIGGNIPRFLLMYCNTPLSYNIASLQITFNGGNMQLLTLESLREATIRNGLIHYGAKDEQGFNSISNSTSSSLTLAEPPKYDYFMGRGSIFLLEYGVDISMPEGVIAGMSGIDLSVQYKVGVTFPPEYVGPNLYKEGSIVYGEFIIEHLSECDFLITGNLGNNSVETINPVEAAAAVSLMKRRVTSNALYVNKRKLYSGAGFVSDMFHKARQIIPKVVSAYHTGKSIIDKTVNAANTVGKVAGTLAGYMR